MFVLACKKCSMGTTKSEGNPKALTISKCDIAAKFARRFDNAERQQVSGAYNLMM
jgi:hypothetical protein